MRRRAIAAVVCSLFVAVALDARVSRYVVNTAIQFTDDPLGAGATTIKAVHLTELRAAIDANRAAAGLPPSVVTDSSALGVPIRAVHITQLRGALDGARSALGLPQATYTDAIGVGSTVKAIHIQELRDLARVVVLVCPTIAVANPSISAVAVNVPFSGAFTQAGGVGRVTFSIQSGTLPAGLTLGSEGVFSGAPTETGTFPVTVKATDANGCTGTSSTYNLSVADPPLIVSFVPVQSVITIGSTARLTATFTGGMGVITNDVNTTAIAASNGENEVSLTTTTTYTLTVINALGASVTATATVTVVATPAISSFTANPMTITSGSTAILTASFSGGTGLINEMNVGSGTPVPVTPTETLTYTLVVTNDAGLSAMASLTVTVVSPPAIASFTADPETITAAGSSLLQPVFSNGAGSISNGVSAFSVASGSMNPVTPAVTTTYTLRVVNVAGSVQTATATVTVVPSPTCTALTVSPINITTGGTVQVTPRFSGGTATITLSISGGPPTNVAGPFESGLAFTSPTLTCAGTCTANLAMMVTNAAGTTCNLASSPVNIYAPPAITGFAATPTSIATGATVTLTGDFTNGTGSVSPTIGAVTTGVGKATVLSVSRTFTLTVTNGAGLSVSRTLTVKVNGTLTTAANLATARFGATATRLPNGKILVAGGSATAGGNGLNTAVIYDHRTNTYAATGNMAVARVGHTATLLPDSKVLITGGRDATGATLTSLELFDLTGNVGVGTFTASALVLSVARLGHTATLLPDGRVLIVGGAGGSTNADLYNWEPTSTASMSTLSGTNGVINTRMGHTATRLSNGKVLLAGGGINTTELYDWTLTSSPFSAGPTLDFTPTGGTATLMPNGRVLIAGGTASAANVQIYDPVANALGSGPSMSVPRTNATATLLGDGRVLIEGGNTGAPSADLFDLYTGGFAAAAAPALVRSSGFAVLLASGKVLLAGGTASNGAGGSSQQFDPGMSVPGFWSPSGMMATARSEHASVQLPNGTVLVLGGKDPFAGLLQTTELFKSANDLAGNFGAGAFSAASPLIRRRRLHTATLLSNGEVIVAGGMSSSVLKERRVELYDSNNDVFTDVSDIAFGFIYHTAIMLPNGKLLLGGGVDDCAGIGGSRSSGGAVLYNIGSNTVSSSTGIGTARAGHTATLLPNGKVLMVGGITGSSPSCDGPGFSHTVTATATLYQPGSRFLGPPNDTSTPIPSPFAGIGRALAAATLLPNGKVLIVGGMDGAGNPLSTAFLYDWITNSFTPSGSSMVSERIRPSMTLLPSGKVLIAGGAIGPPPNINFLAGGFADWQPTATVELYDPDSDTFSATSSLDLAIAEHAALLLSNSGKVLVMGGRLSADTQAATATSRLFQ